MGFLTSPMSDNKGFNSEGYGRALVFNLKQYAPIKGIYSNIFGVGYLQGGVRFLSLDKKGFVATRFGSLVALNTTEDRTLKPRSVPSSLIVPNPSVSPRMIYPNGINLLSLGVPNKVAT